MSVYKFHALEGGDWTIQKDNGNIIEGASTAQAVASVEGGKVKILTFYPYYKAIIDLDDNTIEIDNVDVTADGAAAIVEQLNEEVFTGLGSSGGTALQNVLDADSTLDKDNEIINPANQTLISAGDINYENTISSMGVRPDGTAFMYAQNDGATHDMTLQISPTNATIRKNGGTSEEIATINIADDYADDAAAAIGGVSVGELYHTSGSVKVRLT